MVVMRVLCAIKCVCPWLKLRQSDCPQAYVQALLNPDGKGPKHFVRLPKKWWPKEWFYEDGSPKYSDPVVELLRALYGHPAAGDRWHDKLEDVVLKRQFKAIADRP